MKVIKNQLIIEMMDVNNFISLDKQLTHVNSLLRSPKDMNLRGNHNYDELTFLIDLTLSRLSNRIKQYVKEMLDNKSHYDSDKKIANDFRASILTLKKSLSFVIDTTRENPSEVHDNLIQIRKSIYENFNKSLNSALQDISSNFLHSGILNLPPEQFKLMKKTHHAKTITPYIPKGRVPKANT